MNQTAPFWESGYADFTLSCMGGPSAEVIQIEPLLPRQAKVLDLGCGDGRNALFLASRGHHVTAVDRSTAGIGKLMHLATTFGCPLQGIVSDIRDVSLVESFDLVMAHGVLYYLPRPEWQNLLWRLRDHTRPGGFHIFTLFVYDNDYPCVPEIHDAGYLGSFAPYELQQFYSDWEMLFYDKYVKWDAHPGVPLHYHPIEKMVARKPGGPVLNHRIVAIESGPDLDLETFHKIPIGIDRDQLLKIVPPPGYIATFKTSSPQFGPSSRATGSATIPDYRLELWYYGTRVIYLVGDIVDGRSLYTTQPQRLEILI